LSDKGKVLSQKKKNAKLSIMKDSEKLRSWLKYAIIGVVAIWVIIPIGIFYFYGSPENSGILGDTFGVVNALFSALAFALLIYASMMQRIELEYQRAELRQTRKEFLTNRVTNVVYNQLERFENAIKDFSIHWTGEPYKGYQAFFFLDKNKNAYKKADYIDINEKKHWNSVAIKIYSNNSTSIAQFTLLAYNSSSVVKETLLRSELSVEEMQ
jgi:uncharacterized membrane protein